MSRITTNVFSVTSNFSQSSVDSGNTNNRTTDAGSVAYTYSYTTGTGTSGVISQIYHTATGLNSGVMHTYNLQNLTQNVVGYQVNKSFSGINCFIVRNLGTVPGADLGIVVNTSSGFKEPFGYPTGILTVGARSQVAVNKILTHYSVGTGNRMIGISGMGSGISYEMFIGGV